VVLFSETVGLFAVWRGARLRGVNLLSQFHSTYLLILSSNTRIVG
jgi:hypothetical protein